MQRVIEMSRVFECSFFDRAALLLCHTTSLRTTQRRVCCERRAKTTIHVEFYTEFLPDSEYRIALGSPQIGSIVIEIFMQGARDWLPIPAFTSARAQPST